MSDLMPDTRVVGQCGKCGRAFYIGHDCELLPPATSEELAALFTILFKPCEDMVEPDESCFF